eukprot:scaffold3030_cov72-Cyclotella_meneghiniana.AAC.14
MDGKALLLMADADGTDCTDCTACKLKADNGRGSFCVDSNVDWHGRLKLRWLVVGSICLEDDR